MFIAALVLSLVFAAALVGSAVGKLRGNPASLGVLDTVGFPRNRAWVLAALEGAGAAGLVVGLLWWPLGVAASAGLILYFLGAAIAHLRVGDRRGFLAPVILWAVAVATLVLRVLSVTL